MSEKVDIWMPWFVSDYMRDTMMLSLEEDAFYRRALDFLWLNPKGLPIETGRLSLALRVSVEKAGELRWVLDDYLQKERGYYWSERLDEEYRKAIHNKEMKKINGSKGGRPRNRPDNLQDNLSDGLPGKLNLSSSPSPSSSSSPAPENPMRLKVEERSSLRAAEDPTKSRSHGPVVPIGAGGTTADYVDHILHGQDLRPRKPKPAPAPMPMPEADE
jgi:uncharacterized protein YdaU (DUF1376 family)